MKDGGGTLRRRKLLGGNVPDFFLRGVSHACWRSA